ncbi:MAG: archease [Elusimicrobiota bacterium]
MRSDGNNITPREAKYVVFEHTADIGLEIRGVALDDFFRNAAEGMFYIIFGKEVMSLTNPRMECKTAKFNLTAQTGEDLLISWLNELLFRYATEKIVPLNFECIIHEATEKGGDWQVTAKIYYRQFIPKKDVVAMDIKAATYHDLKIRKIGDNYTARIIFDV